MPCEGFRITGICYISAKGFNNMCPMIKYSILDWWADEGRNQQWLCFFVNI